MPPVSLHEIRNPDGQLIVAAKGPKPPITGVDIQSTKVANLDADKLDGKHLSEIKQEINTTIGQAFAEAGKIKTLNGIYPDTNANLAIVGGGRVNVITDSDSSTITITDTSLATGIRFLVFNEAADGTRTDFTVATDILAEDMTAEELLLFVNGKLQTPTLEFTVTSATKLIHFVTAPAADSRIQCFLRDAGSTIPLGLSRLTPYDVDTSVAGTVKYLFDQTDLDWNYFLVWHNGLQVVLVPGENWDTATNALTLTPYASTDSIDIFYLEAEGGTLDPLTITTVPNGSTKEFSYTGLFLTNYNAFIFLNGVLKYANDKDFTVDPGSKKLFFKVAPPTDTVITGYRLKLDRGIATVNGMAPDTAQNIEIKAGKGIVIVQDPANHAINLSVDPNFIGGGGGSDWWDDDFEITDPNQKDYKLSKMPVSPRGVILSLNGITMRPGLNKDYTIAGQNITMRRPVYLNASLYAQYPFTITINPGGIVIDNFLISAALGQFGGTFNLAQPMKPGSEVFVNNGLLMTPAGDYTVAGDVEFTVDNSVEFSYGDRVAIIYEPATAPDNGMIWAYDSFTVTDVDAKVFDLNHDVIANSEYVIQNGQWLGKPYAYSVTGAAQITLDPSVALTLGQQITIKYQYDAQLGPLTQAWVEDVFVPATINDRMATLTHVPDVSTIMANQLGVMVLDDEDFALEGNTVNLANSFSVIAGSPIIFKYRYSI